MILRLGLGQGYGVSWDGSRTPLSLPDDSNMVKFAPPLHQLSCTLFILCVATSYWSCCIGLFPCSAFIDFSHRDTETDGKKGPFQEEVKWSSSELRVAFTTLLTRWKNVTIMEALAADSELIG